MKEIGVPKSFGGLIYTIKSVEVNSSYKCPNTCQWIKDKNYDCYWYELMHKHGIKTEDSKVLCTIVTVNVKNVGSIDNWEVNERDMQLIDSDGYSYEGVIMCEDALPFRISKRDTRVLPGTQVNYIQLFPHLPKGVTVSKFIVNIDGHFTDFIMSERNYSDWKNEAENSSVDIIEEDSIENRASMIRQRFSLFSNRHGQMYNKDFEIENINSRIRDLKVAIFSRLNNVLTSSECTKLENKISNMSYSLQVELEQKDSSNYDDYKIELSKIMEDYSCKIKNEKQKKDERETLSKKLDDLLELSPRDFELYIGQLYNHLGYITEITPLSNDKGIDILMRKDGTLYGVQCKRYKGTVGSPEIQTFIGALSHAKADKGIFVTTGMFSFEAEKMAAEHPIQLINKIDLAKLILNVINNNN